jgi:hypothetical protein
MKTFLLAGAVLALAACGTMPRERTNDLDVGMSKEQVIAALGAPDSTRVRNGEQCLMYSFWRDFWNRRPGNYSDRYYACFC